jgi:hypothetical protein
LLTLAPSYEEPVYRTLPFPSRSSGAFPSEASHRHRNSHLDTKRKNHGHFDYHTKSCIPRIHRYTKQNEKHPSIRKKGEGESKHQNACTPPLPTQLQTLSARPGLWISSLDACTALSALLRMLAHSGFATRVDDEGDVQFSIALALPCKRSMNTLTGSAGLTASISIVPISSQASLINCTKIQGDFSLFRTLMRRCTACTACTDC